MPRAPFTFAKPALLLAFLAHSWPAQAGPGATLEVSVRVVDRCTIAVPPALPPGLAWLRGGPHPAAHACAAGTPATIHAAPHTPVAGGGPPGLAGGAPPGQAGGGPPGLAGGAPPGQAGGGPPGLTGGGPPGKAAGPHVLVTVSY